MSMIVAIGRPSAVAFGRITLSDDGAMPKVHISVAPATTGFGMS
jgi:hypothetical protein